MASRANDHGLEWDTDQMCHCGEVCITIEIKDTKCLKSVIVCMTLAVLTSVPGRGSLGDTKTGSNVQ